MDEDKMIDDLVKMLDWHPRARRAASATSMWTVTNRLKRQRMFRQWAVRIVPGHPWPAVYLPLSRGWMTIINN